MPEKIQRQTLKRKFIYFSCEKSICQNWENGKDDKFWKLLNNSHPVRDELFESLQWDEDYNKFVRLCVTYQVGGYILVRCKHFL